MGPMSDSGSHQARHISTIFALLLILGQSVCALTKLWEERKDEKDAKTRVQCRNFPLKPTEG